MITDTSLDAYVDTKTVRGLQCNVIFDLINRQSQLSSEDIAKLTNISRTSVCGRLKELEDGGFIYKAGKKVGGSGRFVYYYGVARCQ